MHALLENSPFVYSHKVTWGEMDAFNHVNNTEYFRYFEHARMGHFDTIAMMSFKDTDNTGPILAETHCRFKAPLSYPDEVFIGVSVKDLTLDSFTHVYRVVSRRLDRIVAQGEGKIVYYDYQNNARCALPAPLYNALKLAERSD